MKVRIWGPAQEKIVGPFRKAINRGNPLPDTCMRYYFALVAGNEQPLAVLRMHDHLSDNDDADKAKNPSKVVQLEFRELLLTAGVDARQALIQSASKVTALVGDTYPARLPVHIAFKFEADPADLREFLKELNMHAAQTGRTFSIVEPALPTV